MKRYDEAYYARWYGGRGSVTHEARIARRARLAPAAAEHVLELDVRSALDVGCGEGRWRAPLRHARPALHYQGVDPSEYVVRRFGRRRNIRLGTLAELPRLRLRKSYDLVVCSDVLHYRPTSARAWRRIFEEAGLVSCGLNCWVPRRLEHRLAALERGPG